MTDVSAAAAGSDGCGSGRGVFPGIAGEPTSAREENGVGRITPFGMTRPKRPGPLLLTVVSPGARRGYSRPQLTMYPEKCLIGALKVQVSRFDTPSISSETVPVTAPSRLGSV